MSGHNLKVHIGRYPDGVWFWELIDKNDGDYVITDGLERTFQKASDVAAAYYRAESMRTPFAHVHQPTHASGAGAGRHEDEEQDR